jgi:hypothetical protein
MSYWNGSRGWQKSPHWKCKKPPTLFMRFWCFEVGLRMKIGQYDIYVYNIIVYNYIQNHIIYNIIIYYMNTNHFEASWNDSVAMCSDASAPAASISVQGTLKSWTSGSNMPRLLKLIAGGNTWGPVNWRQEGFQPVKMCCEEMLISAQRSFFFFENQVSAVFRRGQN